MAGVRERMRAQRDELLESPPFPAWGISSPRLHPFAVSGYERDARGWRSITVRYGADPAVIVRTALQRGRRRRPDLRTALARAWPDEPGPAAQRRATIVVEGIRRPVDVVERGRCWVTWLPAPPGVAVTVFGRGLRVNAVWLVPIDDLGPYWRGYGGELRPWPAGLAPHRALIDRVIARPGTARPARYPVRWWRAVRAQQRICGSGRAAAAASVRSLVDQVATLAQRAGWFADPLARQAAIDETIRYVGYREDVSSLPAQRAWEQHRTSWLAAWAEWAKKFSASSDAD